MSLCNLSSPAEGKLHFWYSTHTRVCHAWIDIPGSCFRIQRKWCVLCRILFVLLGNSAWLPFRLWESATKSGHSFGTFSGYPVVLAVERFGQTYVISHYTKVSEICHEELECPTAIRWACIAPCPLCTDGWTTNRGRHQGKTETHTHKAKNRQDHLSHAAWKSFKVGAMQWG